MPSSREGKYDKYMYAWKNRGHLRTPKSFSHPCTQRNLFVSIRLFRVCGDASSKRPNPEKMQVIDLHTADFRSGPGRQTVQLTLSYPTLAAIGVKYIFYYSNKQCSTWTQSFSIHQPNSALETYFSNLISNFLARYICLPISANLTP